MQETQVRSLIRADPTCCRETKPGHHNCWAEELQLLKFLCPRACTPQQEKPIQWGTGAPQWESSPRSNKDLAQPNYIHTHTHLYYIWETNSLFWLYSVTSSRRLLYTALFTSTYTTVRILISHLPPTEIIFLLNNYDPPFFRFHVHFGMEKKNRIHTHILYHTDFKKLSSR